MTFAARTLQGAAAARVFMPNAAYSNAEADPFDSYVGVRYASDGVIYSLEAPTSTAWLTTGDSWLLLGAAGDYWIRCTPTGVTPTGSATGSWLQLNSNRSWYLAQLGVGNKSTSLLLEIATDSGGSNVIDSCTVTLDAEVA